MDQKMDDPVAEAVATQEQTRDQMLKVSEAAQNTPGFSEIQKIITHPSTQAMVKVLSDSRFTQSLDQLKSHPERQNLIYAEFGFALLIFIWWLWRQSKVQRWYGRMWVSSSTALIFWPGALFGVPAVILGDPFIETARGLFEVLRATLFG